MVSRGADLLTELQRRMQGDDNWYVRAKAKHGEVEFSLFLGFAV